MFIVLYFDDIIVYSHAIVLQASLPELLISESDPAPARLILYSNLPITCHDINEENRPINCWVTFDIISTQDIAMRQRLPGDFDDSSSNSFSCKYRFRVEDWKPNEGVAYNNETSLDIIAKVHCNYRKLKKYDNYLTK